MSHANLHLVEGTSVDKTKALDAALSQIERAFGKGSIMRLGKNQKPVEIETISTGSLGLDIALGVGGLPRGRVDRDLRSGIVRQDHAHLACHRRGAEEGRRLRLHRRRACARFRSMRASSASISTIFLISQPDTGEQALEITDTLVRSGRGRCSRHRFGRGPDPARRNRRRDGRQPAGPPGAAHEPGAAQAHGVDLALANHGHLHQSDPHEDRRHVWQPGDDDGRQCA